MVTMPFTHFEDELSSFDFVSATKLITNKDKRENQQLFLYSIPFPSVVTVN